MKKIFTAVVVVVSLALCSVAVADVSSRLNGTYKTTVNSTALGGALNGTWTVKLKNGAYHVADNGHPIVHGKYTIKGSKISLKDTGGTGKCPGHRRLQVQGQREIGHHDEGPRCQCLHRPGDRADLRFVDESELTRLRRCRRAGHPNRLGHRLLGDRPRQSTGDSCRAA